MEEKVQLNWRQKIKQAIWHAIYPIFPSLQKTLLRLHIIWHDPKRQPYHLGWLAPGKTLHDLQKHLNEKWGFGNHFISWTDDGQVLSWRKLESFDFQYHIRVFKDGEIRGHYEYTPESKPFKHFFEIGEEDRTSDFKKFLSDFVTAEEHISHLVSDMNIAPQSQITIHKTITI